MTTFSDTVRALKQEEGDLLLSKHQDYGPKNIANSPGGPLMGLAVRLHDKIARVDHLLSTGADPQHEGLQDTALDIANYGTIMGLVLSGHWPGSEHPAQPTLDIDNEPDLDIFVDWGISGSEDGQYGDGYVTADWGTPPGWTNDVSWWTRWLEQHPEHIISGPEEEAIDGAWPGIYRTPQGVIGRWQGTGTRRGIATLTSPMRRDAAGRWSQAWITDRGDGRETWTVDADRLEPYRPDLPQHSRVQVAPWGYPDLVGEHATVLTAGPSSLTEIKTDGAGLHWVPTVDLLPLDNEHDGLPGDYPAPHPDLGHDEDEIERDLALLIRRTAFSDAPPVNPSVYQTVMRTVEAILDLYEVNPRQW